MPNHHSAPTEPSTPALKAVSLPLGLALLLALLALLWAQQLAVVPGANRLAWTLQDAMHAPFFMTVTLLVLTLTRHRPAKRRLRWWLRGAILVSLALGTEGLQSFDPSRQASFADVLVNLAGGGVTVLLWLAWQHPGRRLLPAVAAAALLVWSIFPLLETGAAYLARNAMAPQLMSWDTRLGRHFIETHGASLRRMGAPADWPGADNRVARVSFDSGRWPRVTLAEVLPDWTPWQRLCVPLRIEGEESMTLNLRLHDQHHNNRYADRVNLHPRLSPGYHVLDLAMERLRLGPRARPLDLTALDTLTLYGEQNTHGHEFLMGAPWLSNAVSCQLAPQH